MSPAPSPALNESHATLVVPRRIESVRRATAFLVQAARARHVPAAASPLFEVAVSEAVTNAVRHARDAEAEHTMTCDLEVSDGRLTLRILNEDARFALPDAAPGPPSIEFLREHGYGLSIIRSVFPLVRVVERDGRFGVELQLTF
jgi:anti-sigma regulatory factor (Ser/Thr protein kinase)